VKLSLVPRTSEFYDLFAQAGRTALEAAQKTEQRFKEFPNSAVTQEQIKEIEHAGDSITQQLIELLNTQYMTPFDREDIYELATAVDDVVDFIEEASARLDLYGVDNMTRHAIELCRVLVGAVGHLATALAELKAGRGLATELVAAKEFEDEGDRIVRDAIADLFRSSTIDPLIVIKWKDIYEALEDAIDACERVANVLANVVMKNV
jgi:predicted phosphate transport protein (TIGR00153 family)